MLINLEKPFCLTWRKGYLQQHGDGRRYICLFNDNDDRTIISYARYLMSVKLGYFVPDTLEVDHIDNDKTNDNIDNLQLLTPEQNKLKQEWYFTMHQEEHYGTHCASCGVPMLLTQRELNNRIHKGVEYPYCSRSCAAAYNHYLRKNG